MIRRRQFITLLGARRRHEVIASEVLKALNFREDLCDSLDQAQSARRQMRRRSRNTVDLTVDFVDPRLDLCQSVAQRESSGFRPFPSPRLLTRR